MIVTEMMRPSLGLVRFLFSNAIAFPRSSRLAALGDRAPFRCSRCIEVRLRTDCRSVSSCAINEVAAAILGKRGANSGMGIVAGAVNSKTGPSYQRDVLKKA